MEVFTAIAQMIILPCVIVLAYLSRRNYLDSKNRMTEIERRLGMVEGRLDVLEDKRRRQV